jgi:hypothetical protein
MIVEKVTFAQIELKDLAKTDLMECVGEAMDE